MAKHPCDAIVIACIDFRFQKYIRDFLDTNLKDKTYDYVGFAGSTKNLKTILKQIAISVKLHDVKYVILIHHQECGAYGTASTPKKHAKELHKAKEEILAKYPYLTVDLYFLDLSGAFEKVS
ncbi:MAG: hypothetical protein HYV39_01200 [Candidatus Levybacteria bacterium]|nr:hypothetical protein [Candidatus Levybacteria bacterium]